MTEIKNTTKKALGIMNDLLYRGYDDIYSAYGRPSYYKVNAWREIEERARATSGYNHDLHIVGASSHFFSTVYSYTEEDGTLCIVKDTHANTFIIKVPAEDIEKFDALESIA